MLKYLINREMQVKNTIEMPPQSSKNGYYLKD
jgi:hypothetical protein